MCIDLNDWPEREAGSYEAYKALSPSIKPFKTKNAIVYNEGWKELNYRDEDGRLWSIKLFTKRPEMHSL